jgi:hypothetical protein
MTQRGPCSPKPLPINRASLPFFGLSVRSAEITGQEVGHPASMEPTIQSREAGP